MWQRSSQSRISVNRSDRRSAPAPPPGEHRYRLTDGRFSGGSHGIVVGHVAPEAQAGGPIAAVREGDTITLDLDAKTIDVDLTDQEIEARLREIKPAERPIPYQRGVLAKYARLVSSASLGAITH